MGIITTKAHEGIGGTFTLGSVLKELQTGRFAIIKEGSTASLQFDLPKNLRLLQQPSTISTVMIQEIKPTTLVQESPDLMGETITDLFVGRTQTIDIHQLTLPETLEHYLELRAHGREELAEIEASPFVYKVYGYDHTKRTATEPNKEYFKVMRWQPEVKKGVQEHASFHKVESLVAQIYSGERKWKRRSELKKILPDLNKRIKMLQRCLAVPL